MYVNTKEARELLRVTATTLRRWDMDGKIKTIRTPSGVRMYDKECILKILGEKGLAPEGKRIAYCRVSSKKQTDDLDRQIDSVRSIYPSHELVKDIGSGINFKRKGLQRILELSMQGKLEELVVSHRDRLCRFGFDLLEWIFYQNNTRLVVLDKTEGQSSSQDLADDVLAIIQVYTCRQMGSRRYKSDKNKVNIDPESESDDD